MGLKHDSVSAAIPRKYYVLVDYDNFAKNILGGKSRDPLNSLVWIVKQLDCESEFFDGSVARSKVFFRLYGGWYFHDQISRDAQKLNFVRTRSQTFTTRKGTPLFVYFTLAESLVATESRGMTLFATCRPIRYSEQCPKCYAEIERKDVRQKLVDTMLCCDLMYLSSAGNLVATVTSDDDLVPPLLQQATMEKPVYHVMTTNEPSPSFTYYYEPLCPDNYHLIFLD